MSTADLLCLQPPRQQWAEVDGGGVRLSRTSGTGSIDKVSQKRRVVDVGCVSGKRWEDT